MCVVEKKTYYQADGSQKAFDRVRRCDIAINSGIDLCSNVTRTSGAARIVEVKPETTAPSSSRKNEIVTENNGHTHIYRPLGRRASQKHKTGHSKHLNDRNPTEGRSSSNPRVFETFNTRRASPDSRPITPISAPPRMDSFPPTLRSEPSVRVDSSGTAVYDLPPSLLNMPRAAENERRPAEKARKVSFGDKPADRRRPSLSVHTGPRHATHDPPTKSSPGLSRPGLSQLPSFRHKRTDSAHDNNTPRTATPPSRDDQEYVAREAARETARRQRALDEALRRRQEELEAAEDASLDREAERARYRRSFDPMQTSRPPRSTTDSDHSSWSRHTSPPAPPSHPRPAQTRTRFASSSPLSAGSSHRHRSYGTATIHQYHYPDNPTVPASGTRRTSDAIRERGREVIERERAKAANEDSQNRATAAAEEYIASPGTSQRWEPVFDEVDERTGSREYYYVTEGSARQEIRRARRDRDDSRRREERRDEFFR